MNTYEARYKDGYDHEDKAATLLEVTSGDGGPHMRWFDADGWNWLGAARENQNDVEWRPAYESPDKQANIDVLRDIRGMADCLRLDPDWCEAADRLLMA
jgi:hypothetical protein